MTRSTLTRTATVACLTILTLGVAEKAAAQISIGMSNGEGKSFNLSLGGGGSRRNGPRRNYDYTGWNEWNRPSQPRHWNHYPSQPRQITRIEQRYETRTRTVTEMIPKTVMLADGRRFTKLVPIERQETYTVPVEVEVPVTINRPRGRRMGSTGVTTINYTQAVVTRLLVLASRLATAAWPSTLTTRETREDPGERVESDV